MSDLSTKRIEAAELAVKALIDSGRWCDCRAVAEAALAAADEVIPPATVVEHKGKGKGKVKSGPMPRGVTEG